MDNKALARTFLDTLWNRRDPEAAAQMLSSDYIEHNPMMTGQGPAGFIAAAHMVLDQFPETSLVFHQIIAEGDLVSCLVHWKTSAGDTGAAAADIFRIRDGRIIEHWDVIQPIPADAANPNGMF